MYECFESVCASVHISRPACGCVYTCEYVGESVCVCARMRTHACARVGEEGGTGVRTEALASWHSALNSVT